MPAGGDAGDSMMPDLDGLDENDPRSLGRFMRKMAGDAGEDMGPEFNEAKTRRRSNKAWAICLAHQKARVAWTTIWECRLPWKPPQMLSLSMRPPKPNQIKNRSAQCAQNPTPARRKGE